MPLIISLCFAFTSFKATPSITLLADFLSYQAHFLWPGGTEDLWCTCAQLWELSPSALSSSGSFWTQTSSAHSAGSTDLLITWIRGLGGECSASISVTRSKSLGMGGGWVLAEHPAPKTRFLCSTGHVEQLMAIRLQHHAWLFWEYGTTNGRYEY